jgi:hypothetical protein
MTLKEILWPWGRIVVLKAANDKLRNNIRELEERLEGEIEKVRVRDLVIRHSRPDIIRAIAESSNYPDGPAATKVRNAYYYPSTYDTVINEGQLENILAKNITTT